MEKLNDVGRTPVQLDRQSVGERPLVEAEVGRTRRQSVSAGGSGGTMIRGLAATESRVKSRSFNVSSARVRADLPVEPSRAEAA